MPGKHHVTLKAAIWRDGRLLLLRERDESGEVWLDLPGGRLEQGEDLMQAMHREIREELGVGVARVGALPLHVWNGVNPTGHSVVGLLFAVEPEHHDFDHAAAPEVMEALWCRETDLAGEHDHVHMATIRLALRRRLGE